MGLQSAMTTALTGLQAAETAIDVVGNNVANSNTVGFKESNAVFATQFLQTQSIGSAPSESRGGTNPRQIGLGVKVAAINPDFTQGTIEISANPLDVAVQGDGFLIVQGSQGETLYTRNGQLQTNASNEIVTVTGSRVLGFGVDSEFNMGQILEPLRIPLGEETVAQATENVFLSGVLQPTAAVGDQPAIITSEVFGDSSLPYPTGLDINLSDFGVVAPPNVGSTTAAINGPGAVPAGNYEYRLAFTAGGFEGAPSVTFGAVTSAGGEEILVDNLPIDASGQWTGRNLYRRLGSGDFELVAALNATDVSYVDNAAAAIGPVLNDASLNQANYSYYITYYNTTNGDESRPSPRLGSISVSDTNRRIRVDDLPTPDGTNFDAIRIYRNVANGTSSFHLVTELDGGETTFIDNIPDASIIGNPQVDLMGPKASEATALVNIIVRDGDTYSSPFGEGVLSFTGTKGDRSLATKQLTITPTTTLGELRAFMEQAFGIDTPTSGPFVSGAGGTVNNGVMQFTSNMGIENALDIGLAAFRLTPTGSNIQTPVSISFTETQAANGAGSTTDFIIFDSLGIPVNVRLTTVLEAKSGESTTYRWYATSSDNEPISGISTALSNGTITFDSNGRIIGDGLATISVERNTTASLSPLEFRLNFNQVSGLSVSNNLGDSVSSMNMTRQDGFPPGSLTSFIVTESGLIRGVFSNGTERPLGQIRMARFANNSGLQQVGDNVFIQGVNSGEAIVGNPGEGGIGSLTAGAVELSNTDIGQNLIELILASTQYRGGTRVITAAQQLLDELMSLRR